MDLFVPAKPPLGVQDKAAGPQESPAPRAAPPEPVFPQHTSPTPILR